MRSTFLPFSRPAITEEAIQDVAAVLRSGWITTGPHCAQFEDDFKAYTGASHAVALSSATAGMHCLLKALGIGPGDEVITPSLTWVSTVNLIVLAGATPVFADVDRDNLMVTPETVSPLITPKTRLLIPVHYAGAPADLEGLRALARAHEFHLIEDAAHAVGTSCKGHKIGQSGTSVFSFHPIKNMTTGEGGMVCTDDADLAARIRSLRFHGLGVDAYDRAQQGRAPQAEVLEPGYKYNLTDIAAVLGRRQLEHLEQANAQRRELYALYERKLADLPGLLPLSPPAWEHIHACHLYIVRMNPDYFGMDRDQFMARLKERNIGTGLHFRAVHEQKYYREHLPASPGTLPETEWNSKRICSLPLFPGMTENDIDDVVATIAELAP